MLLLHKDGLVPEGTAPALLAPLVLPEIIERHDVQRTVLFDARLPRHQAARLSAFSSANRALAASLVCNPISITSPPRMMRKR